MMATVSNHQYFADYSIFSRRNSLGPRQISTIARQKRLQASYEENTYYRVQRGI